MGYNIRYGSRDVPVLRRQWIAVSGMPYRKTYQLRAGQNWTQAPETQKQTETYVAAGPDTYEPVGAVVARELADDGALVAGFIEMWGGVVFVDHNLVCRQIEGELATVLERVKAANDGKLGGFPDAIGIFEDGRIALREIKYVGTKDRLNANQHRLADLLFELFPDRIDLQVLEWADLPRRSIVGQAAERAAFEPNRAPA